MKLYLFPLAVLQPLGIPIPGYLIQTNDGKNILIDTGLPYETIANPPPPLGPLQLKAQMREEDFIVNRLATVGLNPRDIDIVICTHFDIDHAGNHELFPQAEFVVQKAHHETARNGHARSALARAHWDAPALNYRLINGDTNLVPGVELIETGGHVPGHQSVLVRLPETGPILLAIDAVPASSMTKADTREIMSNDENEADTRASTRKIAEIVARESVALTVYGHDAAQWPTLKHAPDFYD